MKLHSARQRKLELMNSTNIVEAHRPPWVASLVFGVALSGMASPVLSVDSQTGVPVTTAMAEKAVRPAILEASGQVVAWEEASVSVRVTGLPVIEVYARVGDHVKKGQLLALLDDSTVRPEVAQAEAAVVRAQAVAQEETANSNRALALKDSGGVLSAQAVLQATTKAAVADAELIQAKAALTAARQRRDHTHVTAPDDGVISSRTVALGMVTPSGTEFFRLIRRDRLEWRAELTGPQLAELRSGLLAHILLPNSRVTVGRVRRLSPSLDSATRLGLAYVDLEPSTAVRAGMYVKGEIEIARREVVLAPADSVVTRDGRAYAVMLDGDHAKLVPVTTGQRLPETTEILSGVKAGATMIVRGAGFLTDGARVHVAGSPGAAH
jgi:RND family efflux transporter MFP subunit